MDHIFTLCLSFRRLSRGSQRCIVASLTFKNPLTLEPSFYLVRALAQIPNLLVSVVV
jgi:hypothetical protein